MKQDYMSRLARTARWYLPPAEASVVLEDYQEIVQGRSEEVLRRDVGTPKDAVGRIVEIKAYQRWLAVFASLAACVALPMVIAHNNRYWRPLIAPAYIGFLCLGTILSLWWFRRNGRREGPLSRGVLLLLALILLGMAWVWLYAGLVLTESWELLGIVSALIPPQGVHLTLTAGSFAIGLAGIFGLVMARLGDRRWQAVYVLGLSGDLLSLSFWLLLCSMNMDPSVPGWKTPFLLQYAAITLLGLIGTGVSLC